MLNSKKIKGRIIELGLTQKWLANQMNIAESTLNLKINNKRPTTLPEANLLQKLLEINDDHFRDYFFKN